MLRYKNVFLPLFMLTFVHVYSADIPDEEETRSLVDDNGDTISVASGVSDDSCLSFDVKNAYYNCQDELVKKFAKRQRNDRNEPQCPLCECVFNDGDDNEEVGTDSHTMTCHTACLDEALSVEVFLRNKGWILYNERGSDITYICGPGIYGQNCCKLPDVRSLKGLGCKRLKIKLSGDAGYFRHEWEPEKPFFIPKMNTLEYVTSLIISNHTDIEEINFRGKSPFPPNLQSLTMSGFHLKKMPPIADLKYLKEVNVSENEGIIFTADDLPSSITKLDASNCKLAKVPGGLNRLQQLAVLNLSKNPFTLICSGSLPEEITKLDLSECYLTTVPFDIRKMNRLEKLDVSKNDQMIVPQGSLPAGLKRLDVSGCNLSCLGGIAQLEQLESISFADNDRIQDLSALQSFREDGMYTGPWIDGIDSERFEMLRSNPDHFLKDESSCVLS